MRIHAKVFLFALLAVIGLTWVGEVSAFVVYSGGSRLLFYFTKKSFAAGAGVDTAQTLLFVSNTAFGASRIGIKYYNGDCSQEIGPVFQTIGAGQTLRIDVASQAPAFQEGVAEVFFVNAANQPIRWDYGAGSSAIIDRNLVGVLRLPAALLHSDDRNGGGGVIVDSASLTSWAPTNLSGNFADPGTVTTYLAVFAPGNVSGTTSPNKLISVDFCREDGGFCRDGGDRVTSPLNAQCGRSLTLAAVRAQTPAQFQSSFPNGGVVVPYPDDGQQKEKGIVGWLIEVVQLAGPPAVNIIFGQTLQGIVTATDSAHP